MMQSMHNIAATLLCLFLCTTQSWATPHVQQHTLPNGLNILLIEAHHVPMVAMKLIMPAGSRFDDSQQAGTASLLSSLLLDHTQQQAYQDWAAKLDDAAIHLSSSVDKDAMSFSLTVLKEAVDEGVQAMAEALLQPGWDDKRFALLQENAISAMTKAQEEATTHAAQAVTALLFPQHPYGHAVSGDLTSLKNIQLKHLQALYQQQIKPIGSTLAVSGDITMDELLVLLQQYFGTWQGQPQQALAAIDQPKPAVRTSENIVLEKHQALVQWVRLGPSRHDKHYVAALVLNHILGGGGFGSQLMKEMRENRGLVYGVYSWFQPLEVAGAYTIRFQTRADQATEAEAVLREVLQHLADGKITAHTLKQSKTNLMGGFAQRMDSNRERVGLLAMMGLYHRPLDYLQSWTANIDAITLAEVKNVAKMYLQPDAWKRITVGPAMDTAQPNHEK